VASAQDKHTSQVRPASKQSLFRRLGGILRGMTGPSRDEVLIRELRDVRDLLLFQQTRDLQHSHVNPLNRFGSKCFSQTDEDGITIEILRRIGKLEGGVFAEFGVGDGTENNTLLLKTLGWNGFWIGGQKLAFSIPPQAKGFCYLQEWITLDNVVQLAERGRQGIGAAGVDVISLDLDGNDIYLVEQLLANGYQPDLFIVEYNGKFPPPVKWRIAYDPAHTWQRDDYFGASLASFAELFERHDYRLVCCNSHSGANAFFIRNSHMHAFQDVPVQLRELYVAPRYHLYRSYGHKRSVRTVATLFGK
jgi:hypothetical protein